MMNTYLTRICSQFEHSKTYGNIREAKFQNKADQKSVQNVVWTALARSNTLQNQLNNTSDSKILQVAHKIRNYREHDTTAEERHSSQRTFTFTS